MKVETIGWIVANIYSENKNVYMTAREMLEEQACFVGFAAFETNETQRFYIQW